MIHRNLIAPKIVKSFHISFLFAKESTTLAAFTHDENP